MCVHSTTSMLAAGKPARARSSRKGPCSWFHIAVERALSLPTQVSTTMRRPCDSTTKQWIDAKRRPSACAKCGHSQACDCTRSAVSPANRKEGGFAPRDSMTWVTRTAPICQRLVPASSASRTFTFSIDEEIGNKPRRARLDARALEVGHAALGEQHVVDEEVAARRLRVAGKDQVRGVGQDLRRPAGLEVDAGNHLQRRGLDRGAWPQAVDGDAQWPELAGMAERAHAHAVLGHRVGGVPSSLWRNCEPSCVKIP